MNNPLESKYEEYLDDELLLFRSSVRDFLEKRAPHDLIRAMDREGTLDADLWKGMADLGLLGLGIPEEYGGSEGNERAFAIVGEELARASGSLCYAFFPTAGFCARAIARFGNEEQRAEILPGIAAGEIRLAIGLTEPDAGSDLTGLKTRATRRGDHYVVNGSKMFSTGADVAKYQVALVRTAGTEGADGDLTLMLIPTDQPGFQATPMEALGGGAVHTCHVTLDDVMVPVENRLGIEGGGLKLIGSLLDAIRIEGGAMGIGYGQGAFEVALKYAGEREQFGQPIGKFQAVAHMLVDTWMELEAARLIVLHAAWRYDHGLSTRAEASMAKTLGSVAGRRAATTGMQVLGGYSYISDFPMERYYRESKLMEIVDGTNQIQKNVLARMLGL